MEDEKKILDESIFDEPMEEPSDDEEEELLNQNVLLFQNFKYAKNSSCVNINYSYFNIK